MALRPLLLPENRCEVLTIQLFKKREKCLNALEGLSSLYDKLLTGGSRRSGNAGLLLLSSTLA